MIKPHLDIVLFPVLNLIEVFFVKYTGYLAFYYFSFHFFKTKKLHVLRNKFRNSDNNPYRSLDVFLFIKEIEL